MSQNQPANITINNKKALLCSRAFLSKPCASANFSRDNLLKYFPKYIHRLQIAPQTRPIISKVKRVKVLHTLQTYGQNPALRKTLLYNKEKCIQAFDLTDEPDYSREFFEEVKAFINLKSLELSVPILFERKKSPYFKKICQYTRCLSKLRTLELQIGPESCFEDILEINSCEKMLGSLTALKIDCTWGKGPEENVIVLKGLLKNKNILKSTTHLLLGWLNHQTLFELFENFLSCCPKLVFISFATDKEIQEENLCDCDESVAPTQEIVPRYLQALGKLSNLQTVKIRCRDVLTFVSDFTLPSSIQTVAIDFLTFDFSQYFADEDLPQNLMTFCDKWSHLTNLKALMVDFSQFTDPDGFTLRFLQYWLKRVKDLEILYLGLSSGMYQENPWDAPEDQAVFDLSTFFESIQHLRNTLQSLTIVDNQLIYCMKNLPEKSFGFTCLREFWLNGFMAPQEFDLQTLFQTNLRDLMMTGNNEKPLQVVLKGLMFDSVDSFLKFIQSFDRERSDDKRALTVVVNAFLQNEDPDVFDEETHSFTLKSKGFSLQGTLAVDINEEPDVDLESLFKNHLNALKFEKSSF